MHYNPMEDLHYLSKYRKYQYVMIPQLARLMILMCQSREERQRIQAKQLEAEARGQHTDENGIEMRKMRMKETHPTKIKERHQHGFAKFDLSSTHFVLVLDSVSTFCFALAFAGCGHAIF